MTLSLPPVNADDSVQFNFDQIAMQFPLSAANLANGSITAAKLGTGTLQVPAGASAYKLNFGFSGWSMTAATSADVTITHGLGSAPTIAVATPSGASLVHVILLSTSSTQITWRVAQSDNVARTQSGNVYWLAIV